MWAFCMTWRCWFCLVPHEEYLSLVCEQKATKQVEFIRLMAEILHHLWLDGISLHPLNLNIGGIQMQETDAVMNGWNPAPPSMSSQHWNYGGCRGKHQRCYNAIHGRRCRISAINSRKVTSGKGRWQHLNQRYIDRGVCVDKVEYCIISIYLFRLVSPCFDRLSTCQSWAIEKAISFLTLFGQWSPQEVISPNWRSGRLNVDAIEERLVELHCFVNALHAAQNPMMKNDHESLFPSWQQ